MAENNHDRIDSIFDFAAIDAEEKKFDAIIDRVVGQLRKAPEIKVSIQGAESVKQLATANGVLAASQEKILVSGKEYLKLLDALNAKRKEESTTNKGLAAEKEKLAQLSSNEAKELAKLKIQQQQQAAANKEIAQSVLGLVDDYGKLKLEYNAAANAAKNLQTIALKTGNAEDKAVADVATAKARALHDSLLAIEQGVGQSQRNVGNYTGALKVLQGALGQAQVRLDSMTKSEQQNSVAGQKLSKEVGLLSTLVGQQDKGFISLRREVQNAVQALATLASQGLQDTEAFKQLQIEVANSKRELNEFNKQQKLLSSESPALAGLTSAAKGLGAAYAIGAGAAALFANGDEKVAEKLQKLVAVMTLLQGLTELNAALQERSAIATSLNGAKTVFLNAVLTIKNFILTGSIGIQKAATASEEADIVVKEAQAAATTEVAVATTGATTAMTVFRAALIATGIGALVVLIVATVVALVNMKNATEEAARQMDVLNKSLERNKEVLDESIHNLDTQGKLLLEHMKQRGASQKALDEEEIKQLRDKQTKQFQYYQISLAELKKFDDETVRERQALAAKIKDINESNIAVITDKDAAEKDAKLLANRLKLSETLRANTKKLRDDANATFEEANQKQEELLTKRLEKERKVDKESLQELKAKINNEFEIYKAAQQQRINLFNENINNEKLSFTERLRALDHFVSSTKELLAKQEADDIASKTRESKREVQHLQEQAVGKKGAVLARINENIKITEANLQEDLRLIVANGAIKINEVHHTAALARVKIEQEAFKKISEAGKAAYQEISDAIERTSKNNADEINISKDKQLLNLDKDFQSGKIKNLEAYNEARQNIEDDAARKLLLADEQRIRNLEKVFGASLSLEAAFYDDEVRLNGLKNKRLSEQDQARFDKAKELHAELEKTVTAFVEGGFDRQKNEVQDQIDLIEEKSRKEIEAVTRSGLAEKDKADRLNIINIQSQKQKEQLERRQRQIDQERARFERAMSIVTVIQNTAAAVSRDLEKNKFLIPFDIAIGAAQIAAILARPVPKFEKGVESAPKGLGIYGEKGKELVVEKSGRMYLSPGKATLTSFIGGEKIIPHDVTTDILRASNMMEIMNSSRTTTTLIKDPYAAKAYEVLKQIEKKPASVVYVHPAYESTIDYLKKIKY